MIAQRLSLSLSLSLSGRELILAGCTESEAASVCLKIADASTEAAQVSVRLRLSASLPHCLFDSLCLKTANAYTEAVQLSVPLSLCLSVTLSLTLCISVA